MHFKYCDKNESTPLTPKIPPRGRGGGGEGTVN